VYRDTLQDELFLYPAVIVSGFAVEVQGGAHRVKFLEQTLRLRLSCVSGE
jgi:hypothetical protein